MIEHIPTLYWHVWFLKIPPHALFALIGLVMGFIIVLGIARKRRVHAKIIFKEAFWVLIGLWLGSKLLHYLGPYNSGCCSDISSIINRGFVFYGGLIGAVLAGYLYTYVKDYNFWKHADFWALGAPLTIFIARIGCHIVGDTIGKITSLPWALQWPDRALRHPAALYLSLFNLALFAYLYYRKSDFRFRGAVFLQYLMIYAVGRFLIEFLRVYPWNYLGLTFSQLISIGIFIPALTIYIIKSRS